MLPVSAWPPGPPGAALSPFGRPRDLCVPSCGYVLPKGAWIVQTTSNQVVMFRPSWQSDLYRQPTRQMGTGVLPGRDWWIRSKAGHRPFSASPATTSGSPRTTSGPASATTANPSWKNWNCGPPPTPCKRPTHDQALEAWRAWQRKTGDNLGPIRPIPGRVPPNWAGWNFVGAPSVTLIGFNSGGTVLADGQNVVIAGNGWANITQAYSV